MHPLRAQGAIGLPSATDGTMHAQGATEYLVLLAVVLVIALVSIALLGFFPGTATDSQITESRTYWHSAHPFSVIGADSAYGWRFAGTNYTFAYFRIRNTGSYAVRLTKMLGGGAEANLVPHNILIAPGEEACFGQSGIGCAEHSFYFLPVSEPGVGGLSGASSWCKQTGSGALSISNFGFEYVEYVEGNTLTKKWTGAKDFLVKCAKFCDMDSDPACALLS